MPIPESRTEIRATTRADAKSNADRETELIKRVLEGHSEAFSELLSPHFTPLKGLVRKLVRNEFDSEDIVQETVLKAYARLNQFRFHATFRTWLTSIALNEIRQNRRTRTNSRLVFDSGKFTESAASDRNESPFEVYERKEAAQKLHHAIGKLPLKYRLVIEIIDLNEKNLMEGQAALRLSTAAAKTRLFRARRRLSLLLTKSKEQRVKPRTQKT